MQKLPEPEDEARSRKPVASLDEVLGEAYRAPGHAASPFYDDPEPEPGLEPGAEIDASPEPAERPAGYWIWSSVVLGLRGLAAFVLGLVSTAFASAAFDILRGLDASREMSDRESSIVVLLVFLAAGLWWLHLRSRGPLRRVARSLGFGEELRLRQGLLGDALLGSLRAAMAFAGGMGIASVLVAILSAAAEAIGSSGDFAFGDPVVLSMLGLGWILSWVLLARRGPLRRRH